ncbi:acyl transferase/acyl hydrolase/lysophospholipase [Usnea florida]
MSQDSTPGEDGCDVCLTFDTNLAYCNVCDANLCPTCWEKQIAHRPSTRRRDGGMPHEKTDLALSRKIDSALRPRRTEEKETELHAQDQATTWFGVTRTPNRIGFGVGDRYDSLLAKYLPHERLSLYPSLGCFIGSSNAGKSSLINLLITLRQQERDREYMKPVVGTATGSNQPTSSHVHLYEDPESSKTFSPIFYVDCEGLDAGETEPRSESLVAKQVSRATRFVWRKVRNLVWAGENEQSSRQFMTTNLYSRILYVFSDVVVFVLENPSRTIEGVAEKLLEWGSKAVQHSVNQASRPHAIIVLNKADSTGDETWWDMDDAKTWLFKNLDKHVMSNPRFSAYRNYLQSNNRTTEQLLQIFYPSVKVVRIPALSNGIGRPNLIKEQMSKLYTTMKEACEEVRQCKEDNRLLLNADQFSPYLQLAFDHFTSDDGLTKPFDFVQASFLTSPISSDFASNIERLGILLTPQLRQQDIEPSATPALSSVVQKISFMAAPAIMLDAARNGRLGKAELMLHWYRKSLDQGLNSFLDTYWPCEIQDCCTNRKSHQKGRHQNKKGELFLADGGVSQDYQCEMPPKRLSAMFLKEIEVKLSELLDRKQVTETNLSDLDRAKRIHVMETRKFYTDNKWTFDEGTGYFDNTCCLCCLMEVAETCLPCGHVLCAKCVENFGSAEELKIQIDNCPLHEHLPWTTAPTLYLKPPAAGLRVLTLDGGGIRGITQLVILQQLERQLGGAIPIQSFFDLVVGTSIGGIIASGLIANGWSTDKCIGQFEELFKIGFVKKKLFMMADLVTWGAIRPWVYRYSTDKLESALQAAFPSDHCLFGGIGTENRNFGAKLALTATATNGGAFVFGSYNRSEAARRVTYNFMRTRSPLDEIKIWEAARATSAAPTWFKSFHHKGSQRVFVDGALYHNNPIFIAEQELNYIWPRPKADVMVSIGTGMDGRLEIGRDSRKEKERKSETAHSAPWWNPWQKSPMYDLAQIAVEHVKNSLDSQNTWETYLRSKKGESEKSYVRLNTIIDDLPELDAVSKIDDLRTKSEKYWTKPEQRQLLRSLANHLLATCFYSNLEKAGEIHLGGYSVTGESRIYRSFSFTAERAHANQII